MAVSPVLLVAADGGHPARLWPLRPRWHEHTRFWITLHTADLAAQEATAPLPPRRRPVLRGAVAPVRTTLAAIRAFARYRPTVVVSTGARGALPFLLLARLLRVPTLPVEVHDRVTTPTRTTLLCHPSTGRRSPLLRLRRRRSAATGPGPARPRR